MLQIYLHSLEDDMKWAPEKDYSDVNKKYKIYTWGIHTINDNITREGAHEMIHNFLKFKFNSVKYFISDTSSNFGAFYFEEIEDEAYFLLFSSNYRRNSKNKLIIE